MASAPEPPPEPKVITAACAEDSNVTRPITVTALYEPPSGFGGVIILPQDLFISDISQQDADERAEAYARQFLLCGFETTIQYAVPEEIYVKDPLGGAEVYKLELNEDKSKLHEDAQRVAVTYKANTMKVDDPVTGDPVTLILPDYFRLPNTFPPAGTTDPDDPTGPKQFSTHARILSVTGFSTVSLEDAERNALQNAQVQMEAIYCNGTILPLCPADAEMKTPPVDKFCDMFPELVVSETLTFMETSRLRKLAKNQCTGFGSGIGYLPWVVYVKPVIPAPPETGDPPAEVEIVDVEVTIDPGTLNGIIPTGWNTKFTRSATGVEYLSLACTTSGGHVTAVDYDWNPTPRPAPNVNAGAPPTSFYVPLAILAEGFAYPVCNYRNFTAAVTEVYRADKVTTTPGEFPLEIYYTWVVTQPA